VYHKEFILFIYLSLQNMNLVLSTETTT
jgi:hypothetical protein